MGVYNSNINDIEAHEVATNTDRMGTSWGSER